MTQRIGDLAKKLGAEVVGTVPDYSAGAFGIAKLARTLRERLEPGQGKRPGRPSNPNWSKRSKVPLAAATEERLEQLARLLSDEHRKVSPMQAAAQILEEGTASYFSQAMRSGRRLRDTERIEPLASGNLIASSRFPHLVQSGLLAEIGLWRDKVATMPQRVFPNAP
jgi:hypothetical protein